MAYPAEVRIVEVGPRDGLQNEKLDIGTANKIALVDRLSADAAGIVATLFALGQLAAEIAGTDAAGALIDRYHFMRGFAAGHPEAAAIYRAID